MHGRKMRVLPQHCLKLGLGTRTGLLPLEDCFSQASDHCGSRERPESQVLAAVWDRLLAQRTKPLPRSGLV
jgi:hypothetical protein